MSDTSALHAYLAIAAQSPEETVLRLLIELGAQVVGADEGSLLVLDPEKRDLVFAMTVGGSEHQLIGRRVPVGEGLTGLAALTQEVQIGAPTIKLPTADGTAPEGQPQAVMAAPMLAGNVLVGVITAVRFENGRFTSKDAQLYARLASVAGVVVHQRQQIMSIEVLERDDKDRPGAPAARLQQAITATVARIAQSRPEALEHVAQLLLEVEALCLHGRR